MIFYFGGFFHRGFSPTYAGRPVAFGALASLGARAIAFYDTLREVAENVKIAD